MTRRVQYTRYDGPDVLRLEPFTPLPRRGPGQVLVRVRAADLVVADATSVARKPPGLSFENAATLPVVAVTALQALRVVLAARAISCHFLARTSSIAQRLSEEPRVASGR